MPAINSDLDLAALREARLQAHCAAQWLARAARAFIPAEDDDSHTNLGWDESARALTTHGFFGWSLALRLSPLTLIVRGGKDGQSALPLAGLDDAGVGAWLGAKFAAGGFEAVKLTAPLAYAPPEHAIAKGGRYSDPKDAAFAALADWFALGGAAILRSVADFAALGYAAPAPRCWPHHFDFATQIAFPASGGDTGYVGAGFSPGDTFYEEPYFYVTLYPKASLEGLPSLAPIGHWRGDGFTGAVAPASAISGIGDAKAAVASFLTTAIGAAIGRLRGG
jgi:hypothetical protein